MVVDIGGGSTELVLGDAGHRPGRLSMDIGCVRLTERHLHDDPPTAAQIAAAEADIRAALAEAAVEVPVSGARSLVGVAGSVTTVAALALGLPAYDPTGSTTPASRPPTSGRSRPTCSAAPGPSGPRIPVMHPGRVDVIGAGALILRVVVDAVGVTELVASEYDILDGLARSVRERGTAWSHPGAPAGGAGTGNARAAGRPKVEMAPDGAAWTRPDPR